MLIAEDEQWIRDAVAEMIEKLGPQFTVIGEVGNGEEAWNVIQEHWPSIVVTDIMMPRKNGLWLCEQIHQMNLPIITIIVSGYDNFQYARQAMRFGINEYVLKPVDEAELHEAFRRSMKRLEGMAELHDGVLRIQQFIDRLPGFEPAVACRRSTYAGFPYFEAEGGIPERSQKPACYSVVQME
ncbi:response regulator [Paenibacillus sp. TAB 01]|uniref:response regulator n=1 Tax=Paenibacillus sp. TAB 01 TaxID=3368988 RepID=UPI003750B345